MVAADSGATSASAVIASAVPNQRKWRGYRLGCLTYADPSQTVRVSQRSGRSAYAASSVLLLQNVLTHGYRSLVVIGRFWPMLGGSDRSRWRLIGAADHRGRVRGREAPAFSSGYDRLKSHGKNRRDANPKEGVVDAGRFQLGNQAFVAEMIGREGDQQQQDRDYEPTDGNHEYR